MVHPIWSQSEKRQALHEDLCYMLPTQGEGIGWLCLRNKCLNYCESKSVSKAVCLAQHLIHTGVTRGWLREEADLPGLNDSGAAAVIRQPQRTVRKFLYIQLLSINQPI